MSIQRDNILSAVEQTIPHQPPQMIQELGTDQADGVNIEVVDGVIQLVDGSIPFEKMRQTDLVPHSIPLSSVVGATGLVMTATPADSVFAQKVTSNARGLTTNLADANTKTSTGLVQFQLPNNYVAGGDVRVAIASKLLCASGDTIDSDDGSDVDVEVYVQSRADGTVGSDICDTDAQAGFAADDTVYVKTFVVTPTGLVPGDVLNIKVVCRAIEAGSEGGTIQQIVTDIAVLCDEYGALDA